ncbi:MAG: hypothetical protein H0T84_00010 [Tatlockia sp.]|nr:hypothetical protein [Tatlockia sp.]
MLKNIAIFFLSLLALPIAAVVSAVFIAFVLAVFALVSPFAALGTALYVAGKTTEKIIDLLFTNETGSLYIQSNSQVISSTLLQALFTLLAYVPSAVVIALTTVVITPLAFMAFTAISSYLSSEFIVNAIASFFEPEFDFKDEDEIVPFNRPNAASWANEFEKHSSFPIYVPINQTSDSESDSNEENLLDNDTNRVVLT